MNIAPLDQLPNAKSRSSQHHAHRLVRNGCWIILGVFVPFGIWMAFAALCLLILETNTHLAKVLQQQAQVLFDASGPMTRASIKELLT